MVACSPSAGVAIVIALLSAATMAIPVGPEASPAPPSKRMVSYWLSPTRDGHTPDEFLALLRAQGGSAVASSVFLYCGDAILIDGTFHDGNSTACTTIIPELRAMGIGAERVVGAANITAMRAAFADPSPSIASMAAMVKATPGLTGMSWDIEPKGTDAQ